MVDARMRRLVVKQPDDDPFFYGYRETRVIDPTGQSRLEQRPLTRLELLHPLESDYEMASTLHAKLLTYLHMALEWAVSKLSGAEVLHDVEIWWDNPERTHHRPDLCVIFGGTVWPDLSSFYVAEQGVRPVLIIEVTSRATHQNDWQEKFDHYARFGVEWYLIIDRIALRADGTVDLTLYHLEDGRYRPAAADHQDRLWLEPVRLWITGRVDAVECYDENGRLFQTPAAARESWLEAEAAATQAIARADQAFAHAEAATIRADQATARAEAETIRADQAIVRAEQEAEARRQAIARAEQEVEARRAAEAKLAEVLARLQELEPKRP